jgi:hypothetical protein
MRGQDQSIGLCQWDDRAHECLRVCVHSDLVRHAVVGLRVEAATSDAIAVAAIDCVLVHAAVNHHGQSCLVVSGFVHVHAAVILHE